MPLLSSKLRFGSGDLKSLVGRYMCTSARTSKPNHQASSKNKKLEFDYILSSLCMLRSLALWTSDTISRVFLAAALKRFRPPLVSLMELCWGTARSWSRYTARSSTSAHTRTESNKSLKGLSTSCHSWEVIECFTASLRRMWQYMKVSELLRHRITSQASVHMQVNIVPDNHRTTFFIEMSCRRQRYRKHQPFEMLWQERLSVIPNL